MSLLTIMPQSAAFRPLATPLPLEPIARRPTDPFARLVAMRPLETVAPGTTFVDEGEPADDVFKIEEGVVKLFKLLADGRRQIVGFLTPGDVFGFDPSKTYTASAEALGALRLRRFPRRQLEREFVDEPALERQFLRIVTRALTAAQDQMLLLGRKSAQERVASFLLTFAERQGGRRRWINLPMNRTDTADYLGLTMETVSRVFTVLRARGCIAMDTQHSHYIEILDRDALRELADGAGDNDI